MLNTALWFHGQGRPKKLKNLAICEYRTEYIYKYDADPPFILADTTVIIQRWCRLEHI
jgi:hypothetical protein